MITGVESLNIGLAFFEGVALIASPCILPILPIILSSSLEGGRKRPFGVIVGFILTFTLFTLFSRQLVLSFGLNLDIIRYISFALLMLFGVIMISSYLTEKFNGWTERFADIGLRLTQNDQQTGFVSGLVFGALVGLIWTPCAGPILAAVIVQTILQHSSIASFCTILAFGLGAAIPMLIIIIFGRLLIKKINFLQGQAVLIRKVLGVVIILAVLAMILGNTIYQPALKSTDMVTSSGMELSDGLMHPFLAPDFEDITQWINSPPLHMKDLRGKVVLIDFWAYSCINCIRTLPYLLDWYNKYHDKGFEIVGIHSPEFDFERDPKNVLAAVHADNIRYPVALDNQFAMWKSYHNLYWPAHYLVDKQGNVVYEHFGEGSYDITENNIRYLLGIMAPVQATEQNETMDDITPETYLGYSRSGTFAGNEPLINDKTAIYSYPSKLDANEWALKGAWIIREQKIVSAEKNSRIKIHFFGKKVFAVMGTGKDAIKVTVKLNGAPLNTDQGQDVKNSVVDVMAHRLYKLVDLSKDSSGVLELITSEPDLEMYTFTFGN